jgi:hypothetical protein
MKVSVVGCLCLSGKLNRLRDMLIAEGFEVGVVKVRRPGHLRVLVNGSTVWSWSLFRKLPTQTELKELVQRGVAQR